MRALMNRSSDLAKLRQKPGLEPVILFGLLAAVLFFIISSYMAYDNLQTLRQDNQ
jgi:hypothetical protein